MRVLIIGNLAGQLSAATKMAFDKGAKVLHAHDAATALELLRTGRGADIVMIDVHEDITGLVIAMRQERIVAPVVACGVNVTPDMAARAIRAWVGAAIRPRLTATRTELMRLIRFLQWVAECDAGYLAVGTLTHGKAGG